jgi:hypothetical protein
VLAPAPQELAQNPLSPSKTISSCDIEMRNAERKRVFENGDSFRFGRVSR